MGQRRKLAAGNWKMNGLSADLAEIEALAAGHIDPRTELLICPPATLIAQTANGRRQALRWPWAGRIATPPHRARIPAISRRRCWQMPGQVIVIVGHSERRTDHAETDADVRAKAQAGLDAGLTVIVCIGETLDQREAGQTLAVVGAQLAGSVPDGATGQTVVVAYEPVWAIGTGKVPTLDQIGEVHDFLRAELVRRFGAAGDAVRLLYGGSVKPGNADEIFGVSNVDGALVGGASLKAADFSGIIAALERRAG